MSLSSANIHTLESCINRAVYRISGVRNRNNLEFIRCCVGLNPMKDLIDRKRCKFIDQCDASFSTLLLVYGFNSVSSVYVSQLYFYVYCCDFVFLSVAALDAK